MPDALIDGTVVAEGEFTLDRARAQEKMRRYSLPDPHLYVLELVKAAVLQGARSIDFEIDTDDVRMRFDGPPFSRDDLAMAEAAALTGTGATAHLGMGLSAAMGLDPRFVRCESGATRLELRPRRPDLLEEVADSPGTTVHVRDRPHPRQLVEFLRHLAGRSTERQILERHCLFCPIPLRVGGQLLSCEWREFSQFGRVAIEDFGVAGFTTGGRPEVLIVKDGVHMETVPSEPGTLPYRALIHGRGLAENVSHSGLVRDAAFAAVLQAASEARPRAVAALCLELKGRLREFPWFVRDLRLEALACKKVEDVPPELAALDLWETATGDCAPVSLLEILRLIERHGDIPYALETHHGLVLDGMPRVLLAHSGFPFDLLKAMLGHRARNVTRRIHNLQKRETNRALWLSRRAEPVLDPKRCRRRRPLQAEGLRGEVGLGPFSHGPRVRFLVDGGELPEARIPLPLAGLEAVVSGPFTPSENFDGVRKDAAWLRALLEVARSLPDLYGAYVEGRRTQPGVVRGAVTVLCDPEFPLNLLLACGCPVERAREAASPAPLSEHHPLVRARCFPDGRGVLESLADMRERVLSGERVEYADPGGERERRGLRLSQEEKEALARVLGAAALVPSPQVRDEEAGPDDSVLAEALERRLDVLFRRRPELPRPRVRIGEGAGPGVFDLVGGELRLRREHPLVRAGGPDPVLVDLLASLAISRLGLPLREERALLEALADLALSGGAAPAARALEGRLEGVRSDGTATGWARDPAEPGRTLQVQLFLDGRILLGTVPAGPEFRLQVAPEHLDGTWRTLSAVADGQELAGCPATFKSATPDQAAPIGRLERVDPQGIATGWTLDPNSPDAPIGVHFYLDGPAGRGEFIGGLQTGLPRPDVNSSTGYSGDHGFRFEIPPEHLDGSEHELFAYGLDAQGGHNPLLDGGPLRFCC